MTTPPNGEKCSGSHGDPNQTSPKRKTGYGNPPIERQFKKRLSGNPRGRPPKAERALPDDNTGKTF